MATDMQTNPEPRLGEILSGIVNDAEKLLKQQLALFKTEVREDLRKTKGALLTMACGGLIALLGGLLLTLGAVHFLAWAFPALALWACYGIVALALLGAGAAFLYSGYALMNSFNPLPDESAEALQENVQWLLKPKNPT